MKRSSVTVENRSFPLKSDPQEPRPSFECRRDYRKDVFGLGNPVRALTRWKGALAVSAGLESVSRGGPPSGGLVEIVPDVLRGCHEKARVAVLSHSTDRTKNPVLPGTVNAKTYEFPIGTSSTRHMVKAAMRILRF
jgi:hypothetical protein